MELQENLNRLSEIEELEFDWDGYGAKPFSSMVISIAKEIIKALPIQPSVFPTGRRSIQLQFEKADKSYLEFEIFEDRIVSMIVPKREYDKAVFFEIDLNDIAEINEIVLRFTAKQQNNPCR